MKAMGENGSLQTCKEARSEGLVDFVGITGHKPRVLAKAIRTGEFDTVLVPLNVLTRQALEELVPLAKKLDVGVAVMKPYSAKTSNLVTCLYQPSLSLLSDEPELKALLGEHNVAMVRSTSATCWPKMFQWLFPDTVQLRKLKLRLRLDGNAVG
jgi:aryl-alcohol dehydrogenase-like predicted oxidoreductase